MWIIGVLNLLVRSGVAATITHESTMDHIRLKQIITQDNFITLELVLVGVQTSRLI